MKKAVCIIVQNYYDIDPRVRRKAEALVAEGYWVDVIALRSPTCCESQYVLNGVQIHTLTIEKQRGSEVRYIFEYLSFFLGAFLKVTSLMVKHHYAVIDVNTLPDFLIFSPLIPKILGAKLILDMHEVMPEFYMSKFGVPEGHWIIRLIRVQEYLSMRFADQVIVINEPIKKLLEQRGLSIAKATIILNSVDERLFVKEKLIKKPETQSQTARFIMAYHGTLTNIYGLDIAIRGFARVQAQMPGAEFWIIGDGPERQSLEKLVNELGMTERVNFVGVVPQQEIPRWLDQCHIGVLATRQDRFLDLSFSNKLPEYIVMKKPVIVSRLKTIRHYFSEKALAYFEPHDTQDISERMLELYRDPILRNQLVENALQEYQAINWEIMKRRYCEVVKKQAF